MITTADSRLNAIPETASSSASPPRAPGFRLPTPLTRFIGRGAAVDAVTALLETARLVTITGAGGSGKTRLALEVAHGLAAAGHTVAWVELASVLAPDTVPQHTAAALGVREEGGRPARDALIDQLRGRALVLVLDNCEHVADACAALVETLLVAAPQLTILATSREPLGVAGERAWLIPPLSLPETSTEDIASAEAVQLFAERARDVMPDFEAGQHAAAIAQICRRLDGLPLAIELAAARVRILPPARLAAMLDDAFRALGAGSRGAVPRHRTLRAVMDWSHELLSPPERTLLARLSVFDAGFSLEAVEQVCADGDGDEPTLAAAPLLELLTGLVDRSLVVMRESDGRARYRLLETVRQYAAERLAESGAEPTLRRRHAAYYVRLVAGAAPFLTTAQRRTYVDMLRAEISNVRQTLTWTQANEPHEFLRLAGMLTWYWFSTRDWREGRGWAEAALAQPATQEPTPERAGALFTAGMLAALQADPRTAVSFLDECRSMAAATGDAKLEAYALNYVGMALIQDGRVEGREPVQRAMEWFRANGDLYGLRLSYLLLGTLALTGGDATQALAFTTEAVNIARAFGVDRELGIALQVHATVLLRMGDVAAAAQISLESLAALRSDPMHLFVARGLEQLALIRFTQGDAPDAVRVCAAARRIRDTMGAGAFGMDRGSVETMLDRGRSMLGDDAFARHWDEGSALDLDAAIESAFRIMPAAVRIAERAPAATAVTAADVMIVVRALGPLNITGPEPERQPVVVPYARPRELFLFLLLNPDGVSREQIGVVFWPEASAAQLKNRFHVALHHLRRALGQSDIIIHHEERYRINPALRIEFDAARFEAAVSANVRSARRGEIDAPGLQHALDLYTGHFLDGAGAGDWHLEHRHRLCRLCIDGHSVLASHLMKNGQLEHAANVLERMLDFNPLHEIAARDLMHCLAATGQPARALLHYQRFAARIEAELDTAPDPTTRELADRIRSETASA